VSLTQAELEVRLLGAANSLRGSIDPADFKQYVFPLLSLKRLPDNWDAEHAQAAADYSPVRSPPTVRVVVTAAPSFRTCSLCQHPLARHLVVAGERVA